MNRVRAVSTVALLVATCSACGGGRSDSLASSAESSTTSLAEVATTSSLAEAATTSSLAEVVTTVDTDGANPFGGDSPEDQTMPNVVCMDLQSAQDEIQDHGVFLSRSVDATGEDRAQIVDSNWLVVAQTPAAGAPIGEGDAVLSVVKFGERDC